MPRPLLKLITLFVVISMTGCAMLPTAREPGVSNEVVLARPGSDPQHASGDGPAGKINSIGDSTTTNLVARAAAEFRRAHPDVSLQTTAAVVPIGLKALMEGHANLVPMSRLLTPAEIADFQKQFGYPPTQIRVAADALAIYVEKSNPVPGLTLAQLNGIFSRTPRQGESSIDTWGQLGLTDKRATRPIVLYGYDPANGVNQTFRQQVLDGGECRLSLQIELTGSAIVQDIAADPDAIGCASIFFAAKRVRAVPLAGTDGQFYAPTTENVRDHKYPLRRFLSVCVNKPPKAPLTGPVAEFVRFLLSREGQQIVVAGGNIPLNPTTVEQGLHALD